MSLQSVDRQKMKKFAKTAKRVVPKLVVRSNKLVRIDIVSPTDIGSGGKDHWLSNFRCLDYRHFGSW